MIELQVNWIKGKIVKEGKEIPDFYSYPELAKEELKDIENYKNSKLDDNSENIH